MKFLTKWWWVILLVVGAVILWWIMSTPSKSSSNGGTSTGNGGGALGTCSTTVSDWNQKVSEVENSINNSPTWLSDVTTKAAQWGVTVPEAVKKDAEWYVENEMKICKPAGA